MYEADGFQAASPYLGDRDKTWKSLDLCQRTRPKKRKEKKKKKQKIAKLRDPSIYIPLPVPFPCPLLALSAKLGIISKQLPRGAAYYAIYTILCHIYLHIWVERPPPHPPKLSLAEVSCHVCGLLMSASAATEAQEAASRESRREGGEDASSLLELSPLKCVVMIGQQR